MTPTKKEYDISKLPRWAQAHIQRLERDLAYVKARVAVGPENSDTFADPYSDPVRPLGQGTTIEFRWGDGWHQKIQARLEGDRLHIMGGSSIAVYPQSSNYIRIGVEA